MTLMAVEPARLEGVEVVAGCQSIGSPSPTRSEHPGRFKFELVNHILLAPFRQTAKEERMRREREKMLMSPRERTMRRRTRTLFVKTHEGGQVQSFVDTAQTPL